MPPAARVPTLLALLLSGACGSRTDLRSTLDAGVATAPATERCNGLDDDHANGVDDPFRDARGRYLSDAHCGACNDVCAPRSDAELSTRCELVDELPRCVATACATGFGPTREGRCAAVDARLCLGCAVDRDCGALRAARCIDIGGEARCSVACTVGCPRGYRCDARLDACVPEGGSCSCDVEASFDLACPVSTPDRVPGAPVCVGRARCDQGVLSACVTDEERCDEDDNDCDGLVDEGFVDQRGAYAIDPDHCGRCGVSCLEQTGTELELACGGDPFAPRCTLACPDARDGVQVGDALDGDLDVASGCECRVRAIDDGPGPATATGELLDENCDGADGAVVAAFYVATDGNDAWPGSPTRPLRSIGQAIARAAASLETELPRPDVFVSAGVYAETLELRDGVQLHGGYRRDFRALDPGAFVSEVRAPAAGGGLGGAALVGRDVGRRPTLVEGFTLRGLDASAPGAAAVGAYLERPQDGLTLRDLAIRAGIPGDGRAGADGAAGTGPIAPAGVGQPPRAAEEEAGHLCRAAAINTVRGGDGGQNVCALVAVHGGAGGAADCPVFASFQGSGAPGRSPSPSVARGGSGGQDAVGPIERGASCARPVCCGLADFTVPPRYVGPRAGDNGGDGAPGQAGSGCTDPLGRFGEGGFQGGLGSAGAAGQPGAGGGGGGAGGGVQMTYFEALCEYADGLGGGGGGGGAGGCGGGAGLAGTSGGPSIALLVLQPGAFVLEGSVLEAASGGRGGPGGAGGDGGPGGVGAFGGALPPEARTTPTLAGTYPGARGGSGGTGGAGGGGGGGCGGASVGIWVVGAEPTSGPVWRSRNRFVQGTGGAGGAGGSGAQLASGGARGEVRDVVVQR